MPVTQLPTRRNLLRAATFAAPLVGAFAQAPVRRPSPLYAYVGCYTSESRHARGDGIHVYRIDPVTSAWDLIQTARNLVNPSFLLLSADRRFLYSVHGDEAYASAFSIDPATGLIAALNQAQTGGRNSVHQALDRSGKFLIVANYGTGAVAVLPVKPDGSLADQIQLVELKGALGPHRVEQAASHPHHVVFDPTGRFVLVPDKGLDRIFVFGFDPATGRLTPTAQGSVASRAGSGPRHLAFHPTLPILWVVNEIASTITTHHWDSENGALQPIQILPTLPSEFVGESTAAEIAVAGGGRFVYASNRGHDSIACFNVQPNVGILSPPVWVPSKGKSPRFICCDPTERNLYAANEQGDTIVTFRRDTESGRLTETGQVIANPSAVCIAFAGGV